MSSPTLALAADPPPAPPHPPTLLSTEGKADVLFHSGEKKYDSGDYAGACADFSESLKLGPKLGTLLNLALCHEQVGKLVTAWNEFSHGAAWASQNNQRDRLEFATQHIRSLEPRLPRIVLQLPASRPIESIDLDGEPVPEQRWYLPLYLDPGEHRVAIRAPSKKRTVVAFRVVMSPADQVVMIPPLETDYNSLAPTATIDRTPRVVGIVCLGLGAAALIAGTAFGIKAASSDTASDANRDAIISTISFVGSAALGITGGWLLWTSSARGHATSTP
jgi:hypothetical protein